MEKKEGFIDKAQKTINFITTIGLLAYGSYKIYNEVQNQSNLQEDLNDDIKEEKIEKPKEIPINQINESLQQDQRFICPLTLNVMQNPVITKCGHSFDYSGLIDWVEQNNTCPICRKSLTKSEIIPNYMVREILSSQKPNNNF